jgi:hypothetical protein
MDDTCRQARVVRTVTLQLTKPIEPAQITGWSDQVPGLRPSLAPSPSPFQLTKYSGDGLSFNYPASWQLLTGSQRFGIHGPAILAAVGQFGSIDAGCTVNSDVVACRSSPIWNVRDDGIVLAYHIGAWLGPISPMPTPSLAPGQTFVDVGGRRAIFSQTPYDSMTWAFTDAPDLIELRWGSNYPGNADDVAQAVIDTWHFDAGYQP